MKAISVGASCITQACVIAWKKAGHSQTERFTCVDTDSELERVSDSGAARAINACQMADGTHLRRQYHTWHAATSSPAASV